MNKKVPEILAPAGGEEQLVAAVRCGADAVYLGTRLFNARASAQNFSSDTLPRTVDYCHLRDVKVYVTLNTLVYDRELSELEGEIKAICRSGADALIIQDLAVAKIARELSPDMPLHASTQTAVHNCAGVRELKDLGFVRAVLARELSLDEMEYIASHTGIELEAFVHGAHCMSVSGQCALSAFLGGRSGNRGMCAQPCRLPFCANGREYALSLKDMSYLDFLPDMARAGICSFKIEGRMKRPEYVAAAVTCCKSALAGLGYDRELLRDVFSRDGFTDGYLKGKRDVFMFGMRGKDDVKASEKALPALRGLYSREVGRIPVSGILTLSENAPSVLAVTAGGTEVSVSGAVPEKAGITPEQEYFERSLSKTGGTPYTLSSLAVNNNQSLFLSQSKLNAMRRDALNELDRRRIEGFPKRSVTDASALPSKGAYKSAAKTQLYIRIENAYQLPRGGYDCAIVPLEAVSDAVSHGLAPSCAAAELPADIWPLSEERITKELSLLKSLGITHVYAENIGAVRLARELGFDVIGGASLNITNSCSLSEYERLGVSQAVLSAELPFAAFRSLGGSINRGALVYGHIPLMRFRACPLKTARGCGSCDGMASLTDRRGTAFPVLCHKKEYSTLLNPVPLYTGDRAEPNADFSLLYFTYESAAEVESIISLYKNKKPLDAKRTLGFAY